MKKSDVASLAIRRASGMVREALYLKLGVDMTRPEVVRAIITHRCNSKCDYCYSWQRHDHAEMTTAQWMAALDQMQDFLGRFLIIFSGGEPYVKRGFTDILNHCNKRGIRFGVVTNATYLKPNLAKATVDAAPSLVDISIDASDSAVHDHVRGMRRGFELASVGLRNLLDARDEANAKFKIRLKPTVTRFNYRDLPALVRWADKIGADGVDFAPVRPEAFWTAQHHARLMIPADEFAMLNMVIDELKRMKSAGAGVLTPNEKLDSWVDHFAGQAVHHGLYPCRTGLRDLIISPDGSATMCWEFEPIGNLRDHDLQKLWRSIDAQHQRSETVLCDRYQSQECANSCLAHRTIRQDIGRAISAITALRQPTV